jgi:glycosyltransferase involved in cell wall biosynthesis
MSVFNGQDFIRESIDSVINQTFTKFEFIIINDGSIDESEEIILSYKDERVKYFKIEHKGLSKALNYGLRKCSGGLIARIDADDIWSNKKLDIQLEYFKNHPEFDFLATSKQVINSIGTVYVENEPLNDLPYLELKKTLFFYNCICHSSVIFKRNILNDIGYYNENYFNSLDYEFWIRILQQKMGYLLGKPLVKYRISSKCLSIVKRRQQNFEVIKIKISAFKKYGFKWNYFGFFILDIYRYLIPDGLIILKKRIFKSDKRWV